MKNKMGIKRKIIPFTLAFILASANTVSAAPTYFQLSTDKLEEPVIFDMKKVTLAGANSDLRKELNDAIAHSFRYELVSDFFIQDTSAPDDLWFDYNKNVSNTSPYKAVAEGVGTIYDSVEPTATLEVTGVDPSTGALLTTKWSGTGEEKPEEPEEKEAVISVNVIDSYGADVGKPWIGQKLIADAVLEDDAFAVTYEWYYEGSTTIIKTGKEYDVTKADIGKVIAVRATVVGENSKSWRATTAVASGGSVIIPNSPIAGTEYPDTVDVIIQVGSEDIILDGVKFDGGVTIQEAVTRSTFETKKGFVDFRGESVVRGAVKLDSIAEIRTGERSNIRKFDVKRSGARLNLRGAVQNIEVEKDVVLEEIKVAQEAAPVVTGEGSVNTVEVEGNENAETNVGITITTTVTTITTTGTGNVGTINLGGDNEGTEINITVTVTQVVISDNASAILDVKEEATVSTVTSISESAIPTEITGAGNVEAVHATEDAAVGMEGLENSQPVIQTITIELSDIVVKEPSKTVYIVGDTLDLSGLVVTANFETMIGGVATGEKLSRVVKDTEYGTNREHGDILNVVGPVEVLVNWSRNGVDVENKFTVNVREASVIGMAIVTPAKSAYEVGDSLDLSNLVVELEKNNSQKLNVPFAQFAANGLTVSPANGTILAETNESITITHDGGQVLSQNITVVGEAVAPVTGVTINPANVTIPAEGGTRSFTATVSGSATDKSVTWSIVGTGIAATISATGELTVPEEDAGKTFAVRATAVADTSKSATASVTVTAATGGEDEDEDGDEEVVITGIAVQTPPAKVSYELGDILDLTGLVVTLTDSNDDTEDVALGNFATKGLTVTPENGATLTANDTTVTIEHTASGQKVTQAIQIDSSLPYIDVKNAVAEHATKITFEAPVGIASITVGDTKITIDRNAGEMADEAMNNTAKRNAEGLWTVELSVENALPYTSVPLLITQNGHADYVGAISFQNVVKNAEELEEALTEARAGDTIAISGTISMEYTAENDNTAGADVFRITKDNITIRGLDTSNLVNGGFVAQGENITFSGLNIKHKGTLAAGNPERNGITYLGDSLTVEKCTFEQLASTGDGAAKITGNAITVFSKTANVNHTIKNNSFKNYNGIRIEGAVDNFTADWSSVAILMVGSATDVNTLFVDEEGALLTPVNSAMPAMTTAEDLAIINGNTFVNCVVDYVRWGGTPGAAGFGYSASVEAKSFGKDFNFRGATEGSNDSITSKFYVTGDTGVTTMFGETEHTDEKVKLGSELIVTTGKTLTVEDTLHIDGVLTLEGSGKIVGKETGATLTFGADAKITGNSSLKKDNSYFWNGSAWVQGFRLSGATTGELTSIFAVDSNGDFSKRKNSVKDGDTIEIIQGSDELENVFSNTSGTFYVYAENVTVKGVPTGTGALAVKPTVLGTFIVSGEGATFDNLNIQSKGDTAPGTDAGRLTKTGVYFYGNKITIRNCDFEKGNGGEAVNPGVVNGVVIYPKSTNANYTINNNSFNYYVDQDTNYSSTGISITTGITDVTAGLRTLFGNDAVAVRLGTGFDDEALVATNTFEGNDNDYVRQDYTSTTDGGGWTGDASSPHVMRSYRSNDAAAADVTSGFQSRFGLAGSKHYVTGDVNTRTSAAEEINIFDDSEVIITAGNSLTLAAGSSLKIEEGAALTLENGAALKGTSTGTASVVEVYPGAKLSGATGLRVPIARSAAEPTTFDGVDLLGYNEYKWVGSGWELQPGSIDYTAGDPEDSPVVTEPAQATVEVEETESQLPEDEFVDSDLEAFDEENALTEEDESDDEEELERD